MAWAEASKIKRAEHIFAAAHDVAALMITEGFAHVEVKTVTQNITFPSVLDYVRFQLIATPMAGLLSDRNDLEREAIIGNVAASATQSLLDLEMLRDGRLCFPQEAHIATAFRGG